MKKKIVKVILSIMIISILVVIIIFISKGVKAYQEYRYNLQLLREQAIYVAREYLEKKYEEEMNYIELSCIYDKMLWVITFSSNSDPDRSFSVQLVESVDTSLPISERFKVDAEW